MGDISFNKSGISYLRTFLGLSQAELAEEIGVSASIISRIERLKRDLQLEESNGLVELVRSMGLHFVPDGQSLDGIVPEGTQRVGCDLYDRYTYRSPEGQEWCVGRGAVCLNHQPTWGWWILEG